MPTITATYRKLAVSLRKTEESRTCEPTNTQAGPAALERRLTCFSQEEPKLLSKEAILDQPILSAARVAPTPVLNMSCSSQLLALHGPMCLLLAAIRLLAKAIMDSIPQPLACQSPRDSLTGSIVAVTCDTN